MSYKTIAIFVHDAERDAAAYEAALEIASRDDAHLEVYCLGIDPVQYEATLTGAMPIFLSQGIPEAQESATKLAEWAESKLLGGQQRVYVQPIATASAGIELLVGRYARFADLIITPQPYSNERGRIAEALLEGALFNTEAPVLVIPDADISYEAPFKHALIAWNESDESLSTVRKAMPVLNTAEKVDIVMIDPDVRSGDRSDPGGALAMMLARKGAKADVNILARTLPKVADMITRFAADHGADVIVMGAYGHSRLRQAVLGGTTRSMLTDITLPVLMSH
ncbi:universal stress protein family [Ketogulonicigenium robustum]|uniref:Universal stress protein family n=1 Tax=Ketogulonicigenium robustum TaxID=92947 RepID=A0A1W6NX60_9RHOB|nr:universal stress protein [Ketogulonicigenium robustum]ARO13832.1 universal stress protein family [Ketogulonicigenium robustum]